jgi:D-methionine transport system permease protein
MWDNATIMMLVEGTFVTLYMTLVSTFMGYVLGLPMGIALVITAPKGLRPNKIIYKILDVIVNIVRSIPFLILLIMIIPLTRIIVGKSYGPTATIVPLTLAAAPFIARMVESSLLEVDHGVIEAAQSMGANLWTIIWKVMLAESRTSLLVNATIALGTILGYFLAFCCLGSLGSGFLVSCCCSCLAGLSSCFVAAAAGQCAHGQCCNCNQSNHFLFHNTSPPKSFGKKF